jgi:hypothetical protein
LEVILMESILGEQVLNPSSGEAFEARATDPTILPQPYVTPTDFDAQYPTPLDPNEIIAMCEEVTALQALPELNTALKQETWRELNSLAFTSGSAYISFADGECPEEYTHDGSNTTVDLKNLGAKKSLSISDIMHSAAVAAANWNGINRLVGGGAYGDGLPGASDQGTFLQESVADVKEKEIRLASSLVFNGWDRLLVQGDHVGNSLEFTGIQEWGDNYSCSFHTGTSASLGTGTFTADAYDRFLSEGCAKPTHIFGHPAAIQELMSAYFQLGFQGSQVINVSSGDRVTPGFNFGAFVNLAVGRTQVVADSNFRRTDLGGGAFQGDLWSLRMTHNGEPLVYRRTQIPFALKDLAPGCTAVSFQVWTKTSLIMKHCCAHGKYTAGFTGRIVTTCPVIG